MGDIIWEPTSGQIAASNLTRFAASAHAHFDGPAAPDYPTLHAWSLADRGAFWAAVWDFCGVVGRCSEVAYLPGPDMQSAQWFPGAELNFAENLLQSPDDSPAIIFADETGRRQTLSRRELWNQSIGFAGHLRGLGVGPESTVAAVLPNTPAAIIAMLGTAAVGATWACCSPDFGPDAISERLAPLAPAVLVTTAETTYAGKRIPVADRVRGLFPGVPMLVDEEFPNVDPAFRFDRFPFAHPLYVLFSSGTTGPPKGIIHGAGGTLVQHLKEHRLHCDIKPGDRVFFYTTTGWMMWNWLATAVASRAAIVLYDGSPFHPAADVLLELAADAGVTHFGAGAKYYSHLRASGVRPRRPLPGLRQILSTGSPLPAEGFDYIAEAIKPDTNIASISGGTDIVSCFALGSPTVPVRRGELQVKGLGMDVKVYNIAGDAVVGEPGELVCASAFPSMPVGFRDDPDGAKYRAAYFDGFPGVWTHGDIAVETATGGFVISGRSDATLNPGGVRIGSAEITRQIDGFDGVAESLAVGFRRRADEDVILFVRLNPGRELGPELVAAIRHRLRTRCSPRHVPAAIFAAPDLPRTRSGKTSERAARDALNDRPVRNASALANPECLEYFRAAGITLGAGE